MLPFVPELGEFEYSLVVQSDWESADCEKAKTEPHIVLQSISESELLAARVILLCSCVYILTCSGKTAVLHIFFLPEYACTFWKKKVCVVIGFLGSSLFIYSDLRTP